MDDRLLIISYNGRSFLENVSIWENGMNEALSYFKEKYCSSKTSNKSHGYEKAKNAIKELKRFSP